MGCTNVQICPKDHEVVGAQPMLLDSRALPTDCGPVPVFITQPHIWVSLTSRLSNWRQAASVFRSPPVIGVKIVSWGLKAGAWNKYTNKKQGIIFCFWDYLKRGLFSNLHFSVVSISLCKAADLHWIGDHKGHQDNMGPTFKTHPHTSYPNQPERQLWGKTFRPKQEGALHQVCALYGFCPTLSRQEIYRATGMCPADLYPAPLEQVPESQSPEFPAQRALCPLPTCGKASHPRVFWEWKFATRCGF